MRGWATCRLCSESLKKKKELALKNDSEALSANAINGCSVVYKFFFFLKVRREKKKVL